MTNKEAINVLKSDRDYLYTNNRGNDDKPCYNEEAYELAIKALEERPKGKWKLVEHGKDIDLECPFCGYKRGNLSYGYTMEEVLKDIAEDDTMLTKFCEMCGADMRGDV